MTESEIYEILTACDVFFGAKVIIRDSSGSPLDDRIGIVVSIDLLGAELTIWWRGYGKQVCRQGNLHKIPGDILAVRNCPASWDINTLFKDIRLNVETFGDGLDFSVEEWPCIDHLFMSASAEED